MPTDTYFNLPEEKRERILAAAKAEFSEAGIEKASINKIVKAAGIPRGSFYMYFLDRFDLVSLLVDDFRQAFSMQIKELAISADGSLDIIMLGIYDFVSIRARNKESCQLIRKIFLFLANEAASGSQNQTRIRFDSEPTEGLIALLDPSQFNCKNNDCIKQTVEIAFALVQEVIKKTMMEKIDYDSGKLLLAQYLRILKVGYQNREV
ncbi:MAG: TetR/AcrR family transcriptional regulator [Bacilli bacterium]|nr:TetR/AcrR family transcriptional regulator [Bacilli bacterium]MBN2696328.1 TetR/AcrR family transcriptional regulator [Bacilli bacterium]